MTLKVRATGGDGRGVDLEEARRALRVLADPSSGVELRALPSGHNAIFPGADVEAALEWVARQGGQTVYWNVNPVDPSLGRPARKADVTCRRWLYLDADPAKPDAHKDDSATDDEKERARDLADRLYAHLSGLGWPAPVVTDSGNGFALLYRVDLPANDHSTALVKGCLYHLAETVTCDGAAVDRKVHNANRLCKLPGSWARKGADTPERPWRLCRLLHVPDPLECVPAELLQALAGPAGQGTPKAAEPPRGAGLHRVPVTGGTTAAYARAALQSEVGRVHLAADGDRNNTLNRAAFSLGQLVGAGLLTESEVVSALTSAALARGLGGRETEQTIRSGLESGKAEPRQVPAGESAADGDAPDPDDTVTVPASDITPRSVRWLWPSRIPLGKLTTFAGVGGLGKTFVLCDIAARITVGAEWPDLPGERPRGKVLFVSGEDDPDDTLVPRLIELGADLSRVRFLRDKYLANFTLRHREMLSKAAGEIGEGLQLVVIDPPTAYLAGVDDHKNSELRSLLSPLKEWCQNHGAAMVFNTHVNKVQGKVEAMARVMGSVAWVNAVRAAHLFMRDPGDETEKRVLYIPMKSNLGPQARGLAYTIEGGITGPDRARVCWQGEIEGTANQHINSEPRQSRRTTEARDWLVERFRERREWPSDDLFAAARQANVARNAVFEAKALLDLPRARKVTGEAGNTCWVWWVPEDWEHLRADD